jgi:hypothetical protein
MTTADRSNPFRAFLPGPRMNQSGISYPTNAFVVRSAPRDDAHAFGIDALDAFLLSCANDEISLEQLIARLPCSRSATIGRVERLVGLGFLLIRRVPLSASAAAQDEAAGPTEDERETIRPRARASAAAVD